MRRPPRAEVFRQFTPRNAPLTRDSSASTSHQLSLPRPRHGLCGLAADARSIGRPAVHNVACRSRGLERLSEHLNEVALLLKIAQTRKKLRKSDMTFDKARSNIGVGYY